eukprot:1143816-Pelagomonas_calceolata.AAC.2
MQAGLRLVALDANMLCLEAWVVTALRVVSKQGEAVLGARSFLDRKTSRQVDQTQSEKKKKREVYTGRVH